MNPVIRMFEYKDIERVYDLGIRVQEFSINKSEKYRFWPKETLERFVKDRLSLVIEDDNLVVGFLLSVYQSVTKKLTWENMYIEPAYRERELAANCFQKIWDLALERGANVAGCIVASDNIPPQMMLEKLGFINAGNFHWMLKFRDSNK